MLRVLVDRFSQAEVPLTAARTERSLIPTPSPAMVERRLVVLPQVTVNPFSRRAPLLCHRADRVRKDASQQPLRPLSWAFLPLGNLHARLA